MHLLLAKIGIHSVGNTEKTREKQNQQQQQE
jgi:hypothetical protein